MDISKLYIYIQEYLNKKKYLSISSMFLISATCLMFEVQMKVVCHQSIATPCISHMLHSLTKNSIQIDLFRAAISKSIISVNLFFHCHYNTLTSV